MSSAEEQNKENLTRRDFLCSAAAIVAGVSIGSEVLSQQSNVPAVKALDNPNIMHGKVTFKSGTITIDGYLSRPKANPTQRRF